jgi:hypothetical protein
VKNCVALSGFAVLIAALAGAAQAAPTEVTEVTEVTDSFCADFKFIYDQRFQAFQRLRGFADGSGDADFLSLIVVPNARYCRISRPYRADSIASHFHCAWRFNAREQAVADAEGLVSSIKSCLGPGAHSNTGWESTPPPVFQQWLTRVGDSKTITKIQVIETAPTRRPSPRYTLFMTIEVRD